MKTTVRFTNVVDKELSRSEIDSMANSVVLDLCNILLNEGIVEHRDEARVLLHEIFKNRSDIDQIVADKAKNLLESGRVKFIYDNGYYSNKGVIE
ncbi:hypothetical protein D3C74_282230 [compost metagenome]